MDFRFLFLVLAFITLYIAFVYNIATVTWDSHDVVAVVEGNPQYSLEIVRQVCLYCILPTLASLGFSIVAFVKREKHPITNFGLLLISIPSFVFIGVSFFYFQHLSSEYQDTISLAYGLWGNRQLDQPISTIYTAFGIANILWVVAAMAFITAFTYNLVVSKEKQHKENLRN